MPEEHEIKHEVAIATMQTDIGYLKNDVKEIKGDIKGLGALLDTLAKNWQEFGGITKMLADMTIRLNIIEKTTAKNTSRIQIATVVLTGVAAITVPIFINVISAYIQAHFK